MPTKFIYIAAKVIPQPQYVNAAAAPGCANNLPTTYAATTSTGTVTGSALQQQGQVGVGQVVPIQAGPIQVTSQVVPTQTGVSGSQSLGTCLADPSDVSSIMMAQGFNLGNCDPTRAQKNLTKLNLKNA